MHRPQHTARVLAQDLLCLVNQPPYRPASFRSTATADLPNNRLAYGFEENDFQTAAGTQSSLVSLMRYNFYSSSVYYLHMGQKSVLAAVCEQQPSACYPSG